MKKIWTAIALAGALSAPNLFAAYDGTITFVSPGGGNANGGGLFNVTTTPLAGMNLGSFGTFCLEHNENISYSGTYNYNMSSGAINGGVGGGNPDKISIGTAWLYSQFRANSAVFAPTSQSLSDLQQAIWYLEEESGSLSVSGANGTSYYNLAVAAAAAASYANVTDPSLGAYGVVALNLYNSDGTVAQDQLGVVPEPTTIIAAALLLLPFGASTIRSLRKNRVV